MSRFAREFSLRVSLLTVQRNKKNITEVIIQNFKKLYNNC